MDVISVSTFFSPENLSTNRYKSSVAVRRPQIPKNPLKTSSNPQKSPPSNPLHSKLWLSSKISPLPPPPPPPPSPPVEAAAAAAISTPDCRQKGKIFVGNLPLWIKKNEILDLFRQFGPVKSIVLIRSHEDLDRNLGFCFLMYGGSTAEEAAGRAVEFDGMEFRGRVITVRLDDGSRFRAREEERAKLLAGEKRDFRSRWHEERDCACRRFRAVLDGEPENWQNVVSAFERISKESRVLFYDVRRFDGRRGCWRAVEFDWMEFRGRVITVRLDDGSRFRAREEEWAKFLAGEKRDFRSKWHEDRDCACRRFRAVLDGEPENWQNVVSAFGRISKVMYFVGTILVFL